MKGIFGVHLFIKPFMANKFSAIINSETLTLVDFFADWCGPCKMMKPILEELKKKTGDTLTILKIDIDKNQATANAYRIKSVPTLILFKQGKILWQQSGVLPATELLKIIQLYQTK